MSIPNLITLGRILLVPVIVWAIASNQMEIAFAIFVIAGVSDAVDGFLAKRFNMASELGALLDPWPIRRCWSRSMSPWGYGGQFRAGS